MNKFNVFIAFMLVLLLGSVLVGFSYLQNEINLLKPSPSQTSTPTPSSSNSTASSIPTYTPGSTITATPTPPTSGPPANLVVRINNVTYDYMPDYHTVNFGVSGSITNLGVQTAYNVTLRTQVWATDGSTVLDRVSYLSPSDPLVIEPPNTDFALAGSVNFDFISFQSSIIPGFATSAHSFWLDDSGKITSTTMDVASYTVTPQWSNSHT
jgi:hypothetical protein